MTATRVKSSIALAGCLATLLLLGAGKSKASHSTQTQDANHELLHDSTSLNEASEARVASAIVPGFSAGNKKVVWMLVTAYCGCTKCCGPNARGLTASGRSVSYNGGQFVAADTKLFKFGTQLEIPGYAGDQPVEVIDRGGAIKGYHIDVFFPTHEEARAWGRKWVPVTVIEDASN